jgi:cytochrome b involved in lipid metabolism
MSSGRSQLAFLKLVSSMRSPAVEVDSMVINSENLAHHGEPWDCWVALGGYVYDISLYLDFHPGGRGVLLEYAGKDATDAFNSVHPWVNYSELLCKFKIGRMQPHPTKDARLGLQRSRPANPVIDEANHTLWQRAANIWYRLFNISGP